jgi:hypothetical protein
MEEKRISNCFLKQNIREVTANAFFAQINRRIGLNKSTMKCLLAHKSADNTTINPKN